MAQGSSKRGRSKRAVGSQPSVTSARPFQLSKRWTWTLLIVILLTGAGLRFYDLEAAPPGLYIDEAADGANAIQAWERGDFRVFYPEDSGREGLYANISSVFIHLLGPSSRALRLPAALFGILTVAGVYALTAELINPLTGLAAAFFLATSYWHVNFSRIAFRAIGAPFFLVWALYFLLLASRRHSNGPTAAAWVALAGVLYGLGFHTYIAYRVTPILVILVLSFLFMEARRGLWMRRYLIGAGVFVAMAALTMYPLVVYLVNHPDMATNRLNQVSVLKSEHPEQEITRNIGATVGMLYWEGDANWRHNYDRRPEVFWPVALWMTLGVALTIRKVFTRSSPEILMGPVLLLLWLICGAVPAVLSIDGVPHALRSILMLPPVAILSAVGAMASLSILARGVPPSVLIAAVIALACILAGETAYTYFYLWARAPRTFVAFDGELTRTADQIRSLPRERPKVVAITAPSEATDGPNEQSDPFYLPLIALRFLTNSVTANQQDESNIRFYTPLTFPGPLPGGSPNADFCAQAKAALPGTIVVCVGN